jgi:hypothetical protein
VNAAAQFNGLVIELPLEAGCAAELELIPVAVNVPHQIERAQLRSAAVQA